ncbi:hypothetical protein EYF80_036614 [Liparis tanakae]|uniref:Uncharacterized protein n=1 Tax=Liparis tanakae TaxID=230148 RepID=A0A4Z2GJV2_9TELE|nr:hypothetical protein EYF80_036614 [Liparis tanakae]
MTLLARMGSALLRPDPTVGGEQRALCGRGRDGREAGRYGGDVTAVLFHRLSFITPDELLKELLSDRCWYAARKTAERSKLLLYISSPTKEPVERWFCMRVFTRSMGYTAVAPVAAEHKHMENSRECSYGRLVSFQSSASNASLEPPEARRHNAGASHLKSSPVQHNGLGAPVGPAKVTPRAARVPRRRHVTHLRRWSPDQTGRPTPRPGARRAETFRECAAEEKKTPVALQVEALSNFSQTRCQGSRADQAFPLPRCFHRGLHANKIEVLIKGFKQLAHFHQRAGRSTAASPPKESNSRPLSVSPRSTSGLKALTTA